MKKYFENTGDFDLGLWEALGFEVTYRTGSWANGYSADNRVVAWCECVGYRFSLYFYRWRFMYGPPESAMAEVSGDSERGQRDEHHVVCQTEALNWFCDLSEEFRARAVPIVEAWQKHGPEFWRRNREAGVMVWG